MNRKRYCLKISCFAAIVTVVFLPLARTQEKPSVQNQKAILNNPDLEPSNKITNTVRGFVTDKSGRPRGNVFIAPQSTSVWKGIRSDTQGRFTLEDVKPDQKNWVAFSQASQAMGLFAIPEDYAGQPVQVILCFNEAEVEGRVVGPTGKGLADRKVELVVNTNEGLSYSFLCYNKTDQHGNYSCSEVPCGSPLSIQARLVDGNEAEKRYVTKPFTLSDNQIFISMSRLVISEGQPEETDDGKVLHSGRVLDEEGQPIPNVKVKLYFRMSGRMSTWVKSVMTDEQGRWKRRLPKDLSNLRINLLHPEYIEQSGQTPSSAELINGTNVIFMKRGLTLRGIVKNEQGEPIENALIDTEGGEGTTPYGEVIENCTTPRTLADGSFSMGGLSVGSKNIVVSAVGYAPRIISIEIENDMEPIEVTLGKGGTYFGQVVDIDGSPIEGVKIDVGDWRVGRRRRSIVRITETDSKGHFSIDNLPDEGKLVLDFSNRGSGLLGFSKEIPEDLSGRDNIAMYKTPVFVGKVIDAETEEPVTDFTLTNGIDSAAFGDSISWSRYYKDDVTSKNGTFSRDWGGYHISYPFDGSCCLKVEAKGYLSEIAPPMRLGEEYEPCVIRLTKAEPLKGIVVDNKKNPAPKAEVGWMGPENITFIKNGRFDKTGFSKQVEIIVKTNSNGLFELPPCRENGLIVVLHENGYASVTSRNFRSGSQIHLIPWARIKGTIVSDDKSGGEFVLGINTVPLPEGQESPPIRWLFDRTSFSGKHFTIDYVPSTPLHIAQIIQSRQYNPLYIDPQPGETYGVQFGDNGIAVAEKVLPSLVGKVVPDLDGIKVDFSSEQAKGRMILICFWDMNQRPSRRLIMELAGREKELDEKSVMVLLVHTSEVDTDKLKDWLANHKIPFTCGSIEGDTEKVLFRWGVRAQPWLVLTNEKGTVRAGGFGLKQLDEKLREKDSTQSSDIQESVKSDKVVLKLIDSDGRPVAGAKVGTNVETRDVSILGRKLSWNLRGREHNISNEWGEITLTREKLFTPSWSVDRKLALYVLHEDRRIGATYMISRNGEREEINLKLEPACRVHGKLDSEGLKKIGRPLTWANVYLYWDQDSFGVLSHMPENKRFEFFVPSGRYTLNAYGSGEGSSTESVHSEIEVKANQSELNLGIIDLPPTKVTSLIGKPAPELSPIKAWKNGTPVKLADLRGKLVILHFGGGYPSTSRDLPRLVELHEEFENAGLVIISLYNCESMKQLEERFAETSKKFGGEPEVPFRSAVDGGKGRPIEGTDRTIPGDTYAAYDISAYPTIVLINREGKIAEKLNLSGAKKKLENMLGVTVKPALPTWRQRFNKVYFLEEGQVLKRIAPPFISERKEYYKQEESSQASDIERPPDCFTFHWDGELKKWGLSFVVSGKRPLKRVLNSNLSMNQNSYEGPEELLEIDVPGDWIVRNDASEEQKLKALEEVLAKEIGRDIRFVKRTIEREAIVATGSFKYHRLPVVQDDRYIHMFSDDFTPDGGGGGGTADSVSEFLQAIGNRVGMPVIDQTESSEEIRIPYRHHRSAYLSRIEDPTEKAEKLQLLLDNLSRQTNLQFTVGRRPVEIWFVTEGNKEK
ncbi:MAG TPA: hypothetical protein VMW72_01615 [Sedimentisphaerales bacterium]|nr:hypothetical protein [Sedimentisphaerales bacterium]